jgi:2-C-methyl-D-erythritol 2,4-cyclodiphosphate synthase
MALFEADFSRLRMGQGYDLHELSEDRPLILGGIQIPFEKGALGHSDADVVLHALIDALLGASGLGDIGDWFPPEDIAYQNADSGTLLKTILARLEAEGYQIINLDITVFLERPKLKGFKQAIRENLCQLLGLPATRISLKAKTAEGFPPIGTSMAIAASVTLLLISPE